MSLTQVFHNNPVPFLLFLSLVISCTCGVHSSSIATMSVNIFVSIRLHLFCSIFYFVPSSPALVPPTGSFPAAPAGHRSTTGNPISHSQCRQLRFHRAQSSVSPLDPIPIAESSPSWSSQHRPFKHGQEEKVRFYICFPHSLNVIYLRYVGFSRFTKAIPSLLKLHSPMKILYFKNQKT